MEAPLRQRRWPAGPWLAGGTLLLALLIGSMVFAGLTNPGPGAPDEFRPIATMRDLREAGVLTFADKRLALVAHDGAVLALSLRNPHLGQRLIFCPTSRWFEDPAHGSKFDILGHYRDGPSPRGMDRYPVRVRAGEIAVDLRVRQTGPPRGTQGGNRPEGEFCVGGPAAVTDGD